MTEQELNKRVNYIATTLTELDKFGSHPKNMLIEVTNSCNANCIFCANSKSNRKKDKYKKICSWNQIKRIKYNNKFLTPEAHVIIYYVDDKIDVSEKIPIYINNLRQLYKEIYENVKEKSPNAKIDRRFIKYVEEKC